MPGEMEVRVVDVSIEKVKEMCEEVELSLRWTGEVSVMEHVSRCLHRTRSAGQELRHETDLLADQESSLFVVRPQGNVCGEDVEGRKLSDESDSFDLLLDFCC